MTSRCACGKKSKHREEFISVVNEDTRLIGSFIISDVFPSLKFIDVITGTNAKLERLHEKADKILEDIIKEHVQANASKDDKDQGEDLEDVLLRELENDREIKLSMISVKAVIKNVFSAGSETAATIADWAMAEGNPEVMKKAQSEVREVTEVFDEIGYVDETGIPKLQDMKSVIRDAIGAGSETAGTVVIWATAEMIKNPEVMEKAQSEVRQFSDKTGGYVDEASISQLEYLKLVIKETQRVHTPAPLLLPRECQETCEINGYVITAKTQTIANAWAICRDPRYSSNPDKLYPERFIDSSIDYKGNNFEYIPFGAGRRICPGVSCGSANVDIILAMLLCHIDWKLPGGMKHEDLDVTESFGVATGRKEDFVVVPFPYHRSPLK